MRPSPGHEPVAAIRHSRAGDTGRRRTTKSDETAGRRTPQKPGTEPVKTPAAGANTTGRDDSQRDQSFTAAAGWSNPRARPSSGLQLRRTRLSRIGSQLPGFNGASGKSNSAQGARTRFEEHRRFSLARNQDAVRACTGAPGPPPARRTVQAHRSSGLGTRRDRSGFRSVLRQQHDGTTEDRVAGSHEQPRACGIPRRSARPRGHGSCRCGTAVQATSQSEYGWTQDQSNPNRRQPDETAKPGKPKDGEAGNFTLDLAGEAYDD